MTTRPDAQTPASAPREEPNPPASEDSIPQDRGTDNRWQMEPLEERQDAPDGQSAQEKPAKDEPAKGTP